MKRIMFMLVCAASFSAAAPAKEQMEEPFPQLKFSGSFRARYEYLDNFDIRRYVADDDHIVLTRLRLELEYFHGPSIQAFLQVQDNRFFLSNLSLRDFPESCPYENRLDLRQAYLEARELSGTPFGAKIGRQAIAYGDNRVWGPGDWGNTGRYIWDAAKLYYHADSFRLDIIAAKQVKTDPVKFDGSHQDIVSYGVYVTIPTDESCKLDLFYLLRHDHSKTYVGESETGNHERHSVGTHFKGEFAERFDYTGTLAYQFGRHGGDDVRAYAVHTEIGHTFDAGMRPRLHIGCAYASGDSDRTDGKNETFDGLNGAVDAYYGRMNLFAWKNLINYYVGASIRPRNDLSIGLDCHYFQLAQAKDAWYYANGRPQRRDAGGSSGRELGYEIDLTVRWKATQYLELMAGHAVFFPGNFIKETGKAGDASWTFAQATLVF